MIDCRQGDIIGNGVLDANRRLIASDAVLNKWLGLRSLAELLPDLNLALNSTESQLTRVCPANEEPALAKVELTPLVGRESNWQLLRIEIALTHCDHYQFRDAVTDLPDRRALEAHRLQWQRASIDGQVPHALLFMDLDGFKQINDQFGHAVGDRVLAMLADRWRQALRSRDLVVRFGGDEFVALIVGIRSLEDAQPILDRLKRVTSAPIVVDDRTLEVNVTIGVALATDTTTALDELVSLADQSMYAAKRAAQ